MRENMTDEISVRAHAKINIALDITGKRPDGYHELRTIFYELGLFDTVRIKRTNEPGIFVSMTDKTIPVGSDTLVYKAANVLFIEQSLSGGVQIYVENNIPNGAGLGGGSSDAAAVLKGMNQLYGLLLSDDKLKEYAARLGADVCFFINGGAAYAVGIGDKLTRLDNIKLPPVVLVKPTAGVSSRMAYEAIDEEAQLYHPDVDALRRAFETGDYQEICSNIGNSFEGCILRRHPEIKAAKEALLENGADAACMTGSGSTVFGIFSDDDTAKKAVQTLKKKLSGHFIYFNG